MISTTSLIITVALQMGFDPNLALSVANHESALNPNAIGAIGEIGLFQLRPEFFARSCKIAKISKAYQVKTLVTVDDIIMDALNPQNKVKRVAKKKVHLCGSELFDPETNVRVAISHLMEAQKKFNQLGRFGFLVAYNAGFSRAQKIKDPENNDYVKAVESHYLKLSRARSVASVM